MAIVKRKGKKGVTYSVVVQKPGGGQKWTTFDRQKDAKAFEAAIREQIRTGVYRELKKTTFDKFMDQWLIDHATELKPSTMRSYASIYKQHLRPPFEGMQLREVSSEAIQRLVSNLQSGGHAPKTARNVHGFLIRVLEDAVRLGYLGRNPAKDVRKPRLSKRSRAVDENSIYSPEQIGALLDAVDFHRDPVYLKALLGVLALAGLRLGECLGLQNRDLVLGEGVIRVRHSLDRGELLEPKSDRAIRDVAIPARLVQYLRQYRLRFHGPKKADNYVFANAEGTPLDPDNLRKRVWYPLLVRAELPRIRIHDLRHGYASLLIATGGNVLQVRDQIGHASAAFTLDRYGHLFPNSRQEVAERVETAVFGGQKK